ncbi:MAG: energy transducer TonB [Bacteroidota bacterium]
MRAQLPDYQPGAPIELETSQSSHRRLTQKRYPISWVGSVLVCLALGMGKWGVGYWQSVRPPLQQQAVPILTIHPSPCIIGEEKFATEPMCLPPLIDDGFQVPEPLQETNSLDDAENPSLRMPPVLNPIPELSLEEEEQLHKEILSDNIVNYPAIDSMMEVDQEPKPLNISEVILANGFPQIMLDAGVTGSMIVRVLVDRNGRIIRHQWIRSLHPIWDQHMEQSLPMLRFEPAIKEGKIVPCWVNIPFRFTSLN